MKVVVVGTNQKDRERVAKVIKDKYGGLAEMNEGLRNNKRYLENDLALKMEQITALKAERDEAVRIAKVNKEIKEAEKKILIQEIEKNAALTTELGTVKEILRQLNDRDKRMIWEKEQALRGGEVKG